MDDIAKAIGKGRSSLYYYYKNKDEVFDAVMSAEIDDIMAEISRVVDQAADIQQKLLAFANTRTKISKKKKAFFDALETGMNSDEISHYAQRKQGVQKKIRKEESILLNRVMDEAAAKDEIVKLETKEKENLLLVFTSGLRGLKREMWLENSYTRMEPASDLLVQMIMLAIRK